MAEEQNTPAAAEQTAPAAAAAADTKTTEAQATDTTAQTEDKQFTQADVDAAVEKKLARERRKWEREQTAPTASTAEKTAEQKPAAADDSAARLSKANTRQLTTDARLAALELGVPAARAAYAARLADLTGIDIDDEEGPDHDAVKKAVQKVLTDIPELKPAAEKADQKPGLKVGADNSSSAAKTVTSAAATRIKPWNKFRV